MELRMNKWTIFLALSQIWLRTVITSDNVNIHYVPSHVKPGYIINIFSQDEPDKRCHLLSASSRSAEDVHEYFTVLSNCALITSSNISSLSGRTISLYIQNESPSRQWKDVYRIKIGSSVPPVHFIDSPYFGMISENMPIHSPVLGLNKLVKNIHQLPHGCSANLHSGDVMYFKLSKDQNSNTAITSKAVFDREERSGYYLVMEAKCPGHRTAYAQVHIGISDLDDNVPEFALDVYSVSLSLNDLEQSDKILQVEAFDADHNNDITYTLSDTDLFQIHPKLGTVKLTKPGLLDIGTSYAFKAFAKDQNGLTSKPAKIQITIEQVSDDTFEFEDEIVSVEKRALRDDRMFVVRNTQYGDLFTVASVPAVSEERFYFSEPAPEGLVLDEVTGIVSTGLSYTWNDTDISFFVNITRIDDPDYQDDMEVLVYIIGTTWEAPVFLNEPKPLWARIPLWIRPYTTVYTLNSEIAQTYNAPVQYHIESGADDKFTIDPSTGEVKIAWRGQFIAGEIYHLAVSAQSVGAAPRIDTQSQILHVQVDDVEPQFYENPYVINMNESSSQGSSIATIRVISFQELPLTFSWVFDNPDDATLFSLDSTNGVVTLEQELQYIYTDRVQYRMTVTVVEQNSNLESEVEVIINLVPENLHEPFFPPTHYVMWDISEDVINGTTIMEVFAVDLDPGNLGLMDFTVLHPSFIIESDDGKNGILKSFGELDYDFIGPEHKYEFIIVATDRDPVSPRSGSATVQVWMTNVDDEAPEFFPPNPVIHLTENTEASIQFIHFVQAYDPDGGALAYSFVNCYDGSTDGQTCDIFNIESITGKITLNAAVPVGSDNRILSVKVTDPAQETTGNISVNFIGVNHPPTFPDCASYLNSANIDEHKPDGTPIINVTAVDTDAGENGEVDITIVFDHTQPDYFALRSVNEYTSELYNLREFDRESASASVIIGGKIMYRVTVQVTDRGRPQLSSTCFFFVEVNDINDNNPIFDYGPVYEVTIDRATPINTEFIRVWAIDDDEGRNADVTYSIDSENPDCGGSTCYEINPTTGWIKNIADVNALDFSTIVVVATDNGLEPLNTTIPVQVSLTSLVTALPPEWETVGGERIDDVTSVIIPENSITGFKLDIFLQAIAPVPSEIIYFLRNGRTKAENSENDFYANQNVTDNYFEVYVANNLDSTELSQYLLKLRCSKKSSSIYTDARLQVTVTDVNDKIPWFQGLANTGKYPAAVSDETVVGDSVVTVIAIDLDTTPPNNLVKYRFANTCTQDCTAFVLDENTGEITAGQTYDRETQAEYSLEVDAYDGDQSALPGTIGPNTASVLVIVQVLGPNQDSPEFTDGSYQFQIDEGQPLKTNIANVTANDPDPEFNYPQYMISEGDDRNVFAVMPETGQIYTTGDLIYKDQQDYVLTYNVFDGRYISSTQVLINLTSVNMFPPFFSSPIYDSSTRTEHDPNGLPALLTEDPSATDPDADIRPGDIQYSLAGVLVTGSNFLIAANGSVFLNDPNIDRDYPNGYSNWQINVVATDEQGPAARPGYAILNVMLQDINDNSPVFDMCCIQGYIEENSPPDTSVLQLVARDVDTGENARITYEALIIPEGDTGFIFQMTTEGLITTTGETLDRESVNNYTMLVRARDNGSPPRYSEVNQTIYITVTDANDNIPYFDPVDYIFDMPEEIPVGGSVNYVQGVDIDIEDNAKLTFIVSGGTDSRYFYMDSIYVGKTGVIKIQEVIDYETLPPDDKTLSLEVSVSDIDYDGSNNPARITIIVQDINDNAPVLVPPEDNVTLPEHTLIGTEVATFVATDADEGQNAIFSYYIDYGNTDKEKKFSINPDTGVVTVRNDLDREVTPNYTVHILAIDEGVPAMTGTATLYVTLSDINDHAPDFPPDIPDLVVKSDTIAGSTLLDFTAIDLDLPENGPPFTLEYCSEPECQDFSFEQTGATTGVIKATRDGYNRADIGFKYYDLTFPMNDNPTSGDPIMSAVRTIRITIESLNDNEMIEAGSEKTVVVYNYMKEFKDVHCGNVYVNDPDDWDLPDKTFTCVEGCQVEVEGTMEYYFNVTSNEGQIYMLEGTPKGDHRLAVQVFDSKWSQTITAYVNVKVIYIGNEAVMSSGSMRLQDITPEEFISDITGEEFIIRTESQPTSKIELFRNTLTGLLGEGSTVDVFTVIAVPDEPRMIDVQFAGSSDTAYYTPARMNGLVWGNKAEIEAAASINIYSAPVDLCLFEGCFNGGCSNRMLADTLPELTNTNATSYVGVNTTFEFECACQSALYDENPPVCETYTCLNGGMCIENWNGFECQCLDGFEGPRCQNTKISFDGNSWAWFQSLGISQCSDFRLSFEIITSASDGLILYNGPMTNQDQALGIKDYIAVELIGGKAKAKIDLGDGELELIVDGQDSKTLNDGFWHSIEVIKEFKTVRLIIDHCDNSVLDEAINSTIDDRSPCEDSVTFMGDQFLLNVHTPLELGGRAKPGVDYPTGIQSSGFNGCLKNLMYVDMLYDLELSLTESSGTVSNGCDREQGCLLTTATPCPLPSTCIGNFINENKECVCHLGLTGPDCDIETTTKDFDGDPSFIEWMLKPEFNDSLNAKALEIWLQFRTRTNNGMLFTASSFSNLEFIKIEVVETHLQVRFDLGSDIRDLQLTYVNVSDGLWHDAYVTRYGNQVILKLDHGEGKYYNETLPNLEHQLIYLGDGSFGGAEVYYKKYNDTPIVTQMLISSCVRDYRINKVDYFPLDPGEDSSVADVVKSEGLIDGCESNACDGVICPVPQNCTDRWRMPFCVCPPGQMPDPVYVCVPIIDCSIPRCSFGDCVTIDGNWRCNCYPGYSGEICDQEGAVVGDVNVTLSTEAIIAILLCLLILLLLLLIILFCLQKQKHDQYLLDPNDDTRENVMFYNEEGAGEEDMHAFDLSRLQKPVEPGPAVMSASMANEYSTARELSHAVTASSGYMSGDNMANSSNMYAESNMNAASMSAAGTGAGGYMNGGFMDGDSNMNAMSAGGGGGGAGTTVTRSSMSVTRRQWMSGHSGGGQGGVSGFIDERIYDCDNDPVYPQLDTVREYEYEGDGSSAGSLSSIQTNSSGDLDFNYLNDFGPQFQKLADIYGYDQEDDLRGNDSSV